MRDETIDRYLVEILRLAELYSFEPISVSGLWGSKNHAYAIRELIARGLVVHADAQGIVLTTEGKRTAMALRKRTVAIPSGGAG